MIKPIGPIILVEDDEDDRYFISKAITKTGLNIEVKYFDHGQAALDYLIETTDSPFLIISDINMPVMDGLQLRRKINESEYLRKKSIPFIFLTTANNPAQIAEAYDLTVQGFFRKADSIDEIEETMREILRYWGKCLHPNNC